MDAKNGGPAFPTLAVVGDAALSDGGLSVRGYFAAHCPITVEQAVEIADVGGVEPGDLDDLLRWFAEIRVRYADAMIAALASSAQPAAEPEPAAPDDDGWIEWGGDIDAPVNGRVVEVQYRSGAVSAAVAGAYNWYHDGRDDDIVRYRVVGAKP